MWRKSCQSCLFSESDLFIAGDQNFAKSRDVCIAFEKTISLKHRNEGSHSPMCYEKTGSYLGAEFPLAAGLHGAIIKPQQQRGLGNMCPQHIAMKMDGFCISQDSCPESGVWGVFLFVFCGAFECVCVYVFLTWVVFFLFFFSFLSSKGY